MNAEISGINVAKDTKFDIKVSIYFTQLNVILNIRSYAHHLRKLIISVCRAFTCT